MLPAEDRIRSLAAEIVTAARANRMRIAVAESCTGGLVSAAITDVPGSSAVLDRGFVTYSNAAKTEMLGVPAELIARVGAVSREVAMAMAYGARSASGAEIAVSITGIAGPGGGSVEKPVGLVHFGLSRADGTDGHREEFGSDLGRAAVRRHALTTALELLLAGITAAGKSPQETDGSTRS